MADFLKFIAWFFHGWRMKLGLLVLLLAFGFLILWARSYGNSVSVIGFKQNAFFTHQGSFIWDRSVTTGETTTTAGEYAKLSFGQVKLGPQGSSFFSNPFIKYDWRWCGFSCGEYQYKGGRQQRFWSIPHWAVILPLTLLSARLLLTKPGNSTQKKITAPTANEGA